MIGLDCNILVQIILADHPANARTLAALQLEMEHGQILVFPPSIATEFLHVITDPRRFTPPVAMAEAMKWLEDFLSNPLVRLLSPTEASLRQTLRWMREFKLSRKRILDTHLATVLHASGVRRLLTSNPGDFAIFDALEIVVP